MESRSKSYPSASSCVSASSEHGSTTLRSYALWGDKTLRRGSRVRIVMLIPVTFDTTLTLPDESELRGFATAQVNRRDFGILNNADNGFDYHGVADEITLEFEFVARAVSPEEG